MLVIEQTKGQTLDSWAKINWSAVERIVERLQARIYRAAEQGHRELAHRWCHHAYHGRKGYK